MKCLLALALAVACLNGITSLAVDSSAYLKPKLEESRDKEVKEALKTVVKRNAEVTNTSTTSGVTSSPSTAQTPTPIQKSQRETQEELDNLKKEYNEKHQQLPATTDYKNVIAVLSGGGLVSVAKAIQTLFVSMKKKRKKKKKKGKKRDSESSSDSEEDEPTHTVAVKIEMSHALQTDTATSKTVVPKSIKD